LVPWNLELKVRSLLCAQADLFRVIETLIVNASYTKRFIWPSLTYPNEPAGEKNEHAAHDNLEYGREERRIHVMFANPCNHGQFYGHHDESDDGGEMKIAD